MEEKFQTAFDLSASELKAYTDCMKEESISKGAIKGAGYGAVMGYFGTMIFKPKSVSPVVPWLLSTTLGFLIGRNMYGFVCLQKSVPRIRRELDAKLEERQRRYDSGRGPVSELGDYSGAAGTPGAYSQQFSNSFESSPSTQGNGEHADAGDMETDLTEPINREGSVSYEELRTRNRNEYMQKYKRSYTRKPTESNIKPEASNDEYGLRIDPGEDMSRQYDTGMRNKYGDIWT